MESPCENYPNVCEQFKLLYRQIKFRHLKFTAANCFSVDFSMVTLFFCCVASHVVILLQFD